MNISRFTESQIIAVLQGSGGRHTCVVALLHTRNSLGDI
jgi:hypothetical protein